MRSGPPAGLQGVHARAGALAGTCLPGDVPPELGGGEVPGSPRGSLVWSQGRSRGQLSFPGMTSRPGESSTGTRKSGVPIRVVFKGLNRVYEDRVHGWSAERNTQRKQNYDLGAGEVRTKQES